jgi:hypothetical protein
MNVDETPLETGFRVEISDGQPVDGDGTIADIVVKTEEVMPS